MEQQEIDKLVADIQNYLSQAPDQLLPQQTDEEGPETKSGIFIPPFARRRMERFLKYSKVASYAVEILTITLFTVAVVSPLRSWQATLMFLTGALVFGIFTVTVLFGLRARIRLLMRIEANTRSIAESKLRIARALENIHMR